MGFRFNVYHQKSNFVWLDVAIREAGLVDSMRVTEGLRIAGRTNPVGFLDSTRIVAAELNHPTELCKTIRPDLIQVKPLD